MKISVITVCFNSVETIAKTLVSVREQSHDDVEHIVVDGASTDGTLKIIDTNSQGIARVISEPDRGIYDAMNKGVAAATGEVIGFLNADDVYAHKDVLKRIAAEFAEESLEALFGDLVYVDEKNPDKIVRYFVSRRFERRRLKFGWMPAHPTLYVRKAVYDHLGSYRTDYEIASDFEFMVRLFWNYRPGYRYIPAVLVRMRMGGISTRNFHSHLVVNREMVRACNENGLPTHFFNMTLKIPRKLAEIVFRPGPHIL